MRSIRLARVPALQRQILRAVGECIESDATYREVTYLVGGAVRDLLLRRPLDDIDLTVPSGARALAHRIAERTGGAYVDLDVERGAGRAVVRAGGATVPVDVTDFRAPSLAEDLRGRDFTVDALAVSLRELLRGERAGVVDASSGLADLEARRLRLASQAAIANDPARALRGIRLEGQLRFRLDSAAAAAIRRDSAGLDRVAAERIGQEMVEILKLPDAASVLRRGARLGVLAAVMPEIRAMRGVTQPAPHRFDVLEHSLRAAAGADRLVAGIARLSPFGELLATHLAEPLGGGVTRRETLKLAALLHDVAKPETRAIIGGRIRFFGHDLTGAGRARAIGERLRLPANAVRLVETLVRHHLRVMHLEQAGEVTRRARYRFFRDLGDDARDLLLLDLADASALSGVSPFAVWRRSALARELMAGWHEERAVLTAPPLLRGDDVMAAFGLPPGPEVGRLLRLAREAQDLGLVRTREEALASLGDAGGRDGGRGGDPGHPAPDVHAGPAKHDRSRRSRGEAHPADGESVV